MMSLQVAARHQEAAERVRLAEEPRAEQAQRDADQPQHRLDIKELEALASSHDDHKSGVAAQFAEQQDTRRRELARFGNEHQRTRDELLAGLQHHRGDLEKWLARLANDHSRSHSSLRETLNERVAAVDKALAGTRFQHDAHASQMQGK